MTLTQHARSEAWSLYPYNPNKPLPIIFAILITLLAVFQLYQNLVRSRWRRFVFTMTLASTVWIAGFICRSYSTYHVQNVPIFIAQTCLLFLGPPCYAGAEYFILGRVLAYVPYHSPIHPGRVLSTFLILDSVVEALAGNGIAALSTAKDEAGRRSAMARLEASLILQCFLETGFMALAILVEIRCRASKCFPKKLKTVLRVLYVTSAMMLVRCIFRIVEGFESAHCTPADPYCAVVNRSEWCLWVFEVANITVFVVILTIFPPGNYLPSDDKIYLDPFDENMERMGPGYAKADKRPFWLTVLDPTASMAVYGKKNTMDRFWERDNPVHVKGGVHVEEMHSA